MADCKHKIDGESVIYARPARGCVDVSCHNCNKQFDGKDVVIITKEQHDKMLNVVSLAGNAIFFYSVNNHMMKLRKALEAYEGSK